jgi:hypothetical protein
MRRKRRRPPQQQRAALGHENESLQTDYTVGFARPPKHTQFRPGASGNPRGRPKGRANLQDIVKDVLFEKLEVRLGERTQKLASVSALIRTAMNRALKGDHKFLMAVIAFIRLSGLSDAGADAFAAESDTSADEVILANFLERQGRAVEKERESRAGGTGVLRQPKLRKGA